MKLQNIARQIAALIDEENSYKDIWNSGVYYIDGYDDAVLDVGDIKDMASSGNLGKDLVGPLLFHAFYESFQGVIQIGGRSKLPYDIAHDRTVAKELEVLGSQRTNDMVSKNGLIYLKDVIKKDGTVSTYKVELNEKKRIQKVESFDKNTEEGKKFIKDNEITKAVQSVIQKD